MQITPQQQLIENYNISRVTYHMQISNLQTQHILMSQTYSCVGRRNSRLL